MSVRVHAEKNDEASDGDGDGNQGEGEAVLGSIGQVGNHHGEDEGASPWWDAMELGADLCVAIGSDYARGEKGVAVGFVEG